MSNNNRIFLINLDRSPDRLAFMQEQFRCLGLDVERILAVDGLAIPEWLTSEFAGPHEMTPGEVGCYASHLTVAQTIVAGALPFSIVLEDDAVLLPNFEEVCRDAARAAPPEWDYIHLCSNFKRSLIVAAELEHGHKLVRYTRCPVNTAAYILSNRGARKWLSPVRRVRPNDIDVRYAWLQKLDVLGVYPAIAKQSNAFVSDVGHEPGRFEPRNWSPGPASALYGELWTMRSLGCGAYLAARAMNLVNSGRRKLDGQRRVSLISTTRPERSGARR